MAQRYFIELAYNGTRFHGWQIQPNAVSVQEMLEKSLSTVCREQIAVTGAGRTDTGVHASFYVAHFDSSHDTLDDPDFSYKLNRFLSKDLVIYRIYKVKAEAHARFDAISRTYHYFINRVKDPFRTETSYFFTRPLNFDQMNEACRVLFDYTDFTSFSKLHTDVKTNNCRIYQAEWQANGDEVVFTIKADRFLRNMVRAIVGTMLEIGEEKLSVNDFRSIIEKKDRCAAGASAPGHGLFLAAIEYPSDIRI